MSEEPKLIIHEDAAKDVEVAPQHKLAHERMNIELAEKAQVRQQHCWMRDATGCKGNPMLHVQEVGFDMRDVSAKQSIALVSSKDLKGAVPGFCVGCLATAPAMLAEAVYNMRSEMRFGLQPHRWFVRFTDGSAQSGLCEPFDLYRAKFSYRDRATS